MQAIIQIFTEVEPMHQVALGIAGSNERIILSDIWIAGNGLDDVMQPFHNWKDMT